jgi:hypothetical protein
VQPAPQDLDGLVAIALGEGVSPALKEDVIEGEEERCPPISLETRKRSVVPKFLERGMSQIFEISYRFVRIILDHFSTLTRVDLIAKESVY